MSKIFPYLEAKDLKTHKNELIRYWPEQKKNSNCKSWDAETPWVFVTFSAYIPPVQTRRDIRERFDTKIRDQFKEAAAQWLESRNPGYKYVNGWQVHHIFPIVVGGNNDFLSLCKPRVHKQIHNFIRMQTEGMKVGDRKEILVPFFPALIWDTMFFQTNTKDEASKLNSNLFFVRNLGGEILVDPTIRKLGYKSPRKPDPLPSFQPLRQAFAAT